MKTFFLFLGLTGLGTALLSSDTVSYPTVNNNSFQVGEKLRYRVTYGFVDAGEAVMEVKSTSKKANGRELVHLKGTGRTLGGFNAFFKVNDVYESYVDKKGVFPWYFVRRVDEGGYKVSQDYTFKHDKMKVDNGEGKEFKIPVGIQDMVSSFYYARTLDFKNMKKGDEVFYYHSNEGTDIVGIAKVSKEFYQDPTTDDDRWVSVMLKPVKALKKPVALAEIKTNKKLQNMALVRIGRLSVQPVTEEEWNIILEMSETK